MSVALASDIDHEAELRACATKRDCIRYACSVLHTPDGDPVQTQDVRDWLESKGIATSRQTVSRILNEWRRQQGYDQTGEMPALTDDTLAEFDEAHEPPETHPNMTGTPPVTNAEPDSAAVPEPTPTPTPVTATKAVTSPAAAEDPATEHPSTVRDQETHHKPAASTTNKQSKGGAAGVLLWYLVAVVATCLSADTSYRLFGEIGISGFIFPLEAWGLSLTIDLERTMLFGVQELALVACAVSMRTHVRRWGSAGPAQMVAWAILGSAAVAAVSLAGVTLAALIRIALGPLLALIALHQALGLELRVRRGNRVNNGTLARIGRELRERLLSRLGLADEERDAVARTRDRAASNVARLATARGYVPLRRWRLQRALRLSQVAHDPAAKQRMLDERALLQHADELTTLKQPSPWA
ncbi:hypothetical protein [Saccharopolyspora griseoalba]|uniref:Uncharacterized protein n=1 Tax=Saccharopolyspora griseoalba TaxID=1431848 RepID=A0ABW2LTD6_9PSEU